jgi:hypothetical protein
MSSLSIRIPSPRVCLALVVPSEAATNAATPSAAIPGNKILLAM